MAPKLCAEMHHAWAAGDVARASQINERLAPLADALFAETSPTPVKYAAELIGKCAATVRSPLLPATPAVRSRVEAALRHAGVLN